MPLFVLKNNCFLFSLAEFAHFHKIDFFTNTHIKKTLDIAIIFIKCFLDEISTYKSLTNRPSAIKSVPNNNGRKLLLVIISTAIYVRGLSRAKCFQGVCDSDECLRAFIGYCEMRDFSSLDRLRLDIKVIRFGF